mgnify:CR=1 FL=1
MCIQNRLLLTVCAIAAMLNGAQAPAQQPTNSPSATLPGPGLFTYRPMLRYDKFSDAPGGADGQTERVRFMHHIMYGLAPEWSVLAEVSIVDRDVETPGTDESENGLGDARLGVSHRFYRHDFGPIETFRAAAQFSLRMPTGSDDFTNDAVNPSIGVSTTTILGRHGIGVSASYELTTSSTDNPVDPGDGLADHLMLAGSHLYRIWPETYAEGGNVAVYSQAEVLAHFETNGDASLDTALGVLVEAPRWAAECSVILPVAEDLDERPESEFGLAIGVRFLF